MNKKKLLLTLAMGMMLGGCGRNSNQSEQTEDQSITDTMLVIGVWNQPGGYSQSRYKFIVGVNKKGTKYSFRSDLPFYSAIKKEGVLPYTERGDTVYVENGKIVKNLTMEHMAERYVKGR